MVNHLILIRHAAVLIDPSVPASEWRLSEDGRSRCRMLAKKLKSHRPQQIITSTEAKAQETGQILADSLNVACETGPDLQEHDRQGTPYFDRQTEFETAVTNFFAQPNKLVFGRETAVQARRRFTGAVNCGVAAHPDKTVAIVAHGTVITLFIGQFNPEISLEQFWQSLTLPCAFVLTLPEHRLVRTYLLDNQQNKFMSGNSDSAKSVS